MAVRGRLGALILAVFAVFAYLGLAHTELNESLNETLNQTMNGTLNNTWNGSPNPAFNLTMNGTLNFSFNETNFTQNESFNQTAVVTQVLIEGSNTTITSQISFPGGAQPSSLVAPLHRLADMAPAIVNDLGRSGMVNGNRYSFSKPDASDYKQFVVVKDPAQYRVGTGDFSLSAWIRPEGENVGTILYWGNCITGKQYNLQLNVEGTVRFSLGDGDGDVELETTAPLSETSWHHIAAVRQGGMVSIFVDGMRQAWKEAPIFDLSDNGIMSIGADMGCFAWNQLPANPFWGEISSPKAWGTALGDAEVQALYQAGESG